jgi:hypothetical protein
VTPVHSALPAGVGLAAGGAPPAGAQGAAGLVLFVAVRYGRLIYWAARRAGIGVTGRWRAGGALVARGAPATVGE